MHPSPRASPVAGHQGVGRLRPGRRRRAWARGAARVVPNVRTIMYFIVSILLFYSTYYIVPIIMYFTILLMYFGVVGFLGPPYGCLLVSFYGCF